MKVCCNIEVFKATVESYFVFAITVEKFETLRRATFYSTTSAILEVKSLEWVVDGCLQSITGGVGGGSRCSEKSVCQGAFPKLSPKTRAPRKNMNRNFLDAL